MCEPSWKVGSLGSAFFLGWCCTMLWLPRLSDKHGRWKMFTAGMIIDTVLYTTLLWARNLNVMIAVMFAFGLITSIRLNVGFTYLMELVPKNKHVIVGTCWCLGEGCIYLLATIYFYKVSKDWHILALIGYLMQVMALLGSFLLPESPALLMELGRHEEAKDSLEKIAQWNKCTQQFYLSDLAMQMPGSKDNELGFIQEFTFTIEISNLPSNIEARQIRQFLAACTGQKYDDINHVVHSLQQDGMSESAYTHCLVSHTSEESMLLNSAKLQHAHYMGKRIQIRAMKDDEVEMILEAKGSDFKTVSLQDGVEKVPSKAKGLVFYLSQ